MTAVANDLGAGFEILWYKIESVLGRGGFGITYLATDTNLDQLVAIKEYLPHDFAARSGDSTVQPVSKEQEDMYSWGLDRFMSEAQTLAKFKHKNIVRVLSVFKHNNTGYMVMEYEEGQDLSNVYKSSKKFKQTDLEKIYYPIIDGLAAVHKEGFIHRDIKPANIYIRSDGSPVLIDFGAARQAISNKTQALTAMLSIGYAPFEQYNDASGRQGPWTDIYSIGASLYQGITGKKPPESTIRGMALLHQDPDPYVPLSLSTIEGFSYDFLRAIDEALALKITDRPQNLEDFLSKLKGEIQLPEFPPRQVVKDLAFDETIIRPLEREFSGHDIHRDQDLVATEISKTEVDADIDAGVDVELVAEDEAVKTPPKKPGAAKKIMLALLALVIVGLAVAFLTWPEKTDEQIRSQKIESLLRDADKFIARGEYFNDSAESAYEYYSQVLTLEPENTLAKSGISNVAQHYLTQAEKLISHQKLTEAKSSISIVKTIDPEFPGLLKMQAKLIANLKNQQKSKDVFVLLDKAKESLGNGYIYQPEEKSALTYFNKVLRLEPGNLEAISGRVKISDDIIADAEKALNVGDFKQTASLVNLAEEINPQSEGVVDMRNKMSVAKKFQSQKKLDEKKSLEAKQRLEAKQKIEAKQRLEIKQKLEAKKRLEAKRKLEAKKKLAAKQKQQAAINSIRHLIPVGINQKQDGEQVVQDIMGAFLKSFVKQDIASLKQVAQLNAQTVALYESLFKLYRAINIRGVPGSFTLIKDKGIARIQFQMVDLIDNSGRRVETTAAWTKISLSIKKQNGLWLKAVVGGG